MSSLFSDPGWRRGGTLLAGETIELDASSNPVAGRDIVGSVKIFQDENPSTGAVNSARVVYCVAARCDVALGKADAGKFVTFTDGSLTNIKGLSAATDASSGKMVGVLDEYLTVDARINDIVWVVVKGPANVVTNAGTLAAGLRVGLAANGLASPTAAASNDVMVGLALTTAANNRQRVALVSNFV